MLCASKAHVADLWNALPVNVGGLTAYRGAIPSCGEASAFTGRLRGIENSVHAGKKAGATDCTPKLKLCDPISVPPIEFRILATGSRRCAPNSPKWQRSRLGRQARRPRRVGLVLPHGKEFFRRAQGGREVQAADIRDQLTAEIVWRFRIVVHSWVRD